MKVSQYGGPKIEQAPIRGSKNVTLRPTMNAASFGANSAKAGQFESRMIQKFGRAVNDAGHEMMDYYTKEAEDENIRVTELETNKATIEMIQARDEWKNLKGVDALGLQDEPHELGPEYGEYGGQGATVYERAEQKSKELLDGMMSKAQNEQQRDMITKVWGRKDVMFKEWASNHTREQARVVDLANRQATIDLEVNNIGDLALFEGSQAQKNEEIYNRLALIGLQARNLGKKKGISGPALDLFAGKYISLAHRNIIISLIDSNKPREAKAHYNYYKPMIFQGHEEEIDRRLENDLVRDSAQAEFHKIKDWDSKKQFEYLRNWKGDPKTRERLRTMINNDDADRKSLSIEAYNKTIQEGVGFLDDMYRNPNMSLQDKYDKAQKYVDAISDQKAQNKMQTALDKLQTTARKISQGKKGYTQAEEVASKTKVFSYYDLPRNEQLSYPTAQLMIERQLTIKDAQEIQKHQRELKTGKSPWIGTASSTIRDRLMRYKKYQEGTTEERTIMRTDFESKFMPVYLQEIERNNGKQLPQMEYIKLVDKFLVENWIKGTGWFKSTSDRKATFELRDEEVPNARVISKDEDGDDTYTDEKPEIPGSQEETLRRADPQQQSSWHDMAARISNPPKDLEKYNGFWTNKFGGMWVYYKNGRVKTRANWNIHKR